MAWWSVFCGFGLQITSSHLLGKYVRRELRKRKSLKILIVFANHSSEYKSFYIQKIRLSVQNSQPSQASCVSFISFCTEQNRTHNEGHENDPKCSMDPTLWFAQLLLSKERRKPNTNDNLEDQT